MEILLYGLGGILLLVYLLRWFRNRSIPQYAPADVATKMKANASLVLLDVRTTRERQAQHIKGSLHIPLHELRSRVEELRKSKGKEIICYCQTGNRSISAAGILQRSGFNAASMRGGMGEWNFVNR